VFNVITIS